MTPLHIAIVGKTGMKFSCEFFPLLNYTLYTVHYTQHQFQPSFNSQYNIGQAVGYTTWICGTTLQIRVFSKAWWSLIER